MLYALGLEERIVGVSIYAVRPAQVKELPKVSTFLDAKVDKIIELKPDLVLGFSDIQKDIARELIGRGLNVFVTNQRSLREILSTLTQLGALVGAQAQTARLITKYETSLEKYKERAKSLVKRPVVYLEEWDDPLITGIHWFSELVELCGGDVLFKEKSRGALARDRFVSCEDIVKANPDIILASWCGKKVRIEEIKKRPGMSGVSAVVHGWVRELPPEVILQPGPALFEDGLEMISKILLEWHHERS